MTALDIYVFIGDYKVMELWLIEPASELPRIMTYTLSGIHQGSNTDSMSQN